MLSNSIQDNLPEKAGVYEFYLFPLEKYYIGESTNVAKRFHQHIIGEGNQLIKQCINLHGLDSIGFQILEFEDDKYNRLLLERKYKQLRGFDKTINRIRGLENFTKKVLVYDEFGNFVKEYQSASQYAKDFNLNLQCVTECCRGERPSSAGYLLFYKNNFSEKKLQKKLERYSQNKKNKTVYQYDLKDNFIDSFQSIAEAAIKTNSLPCKIGSCCNNKRKSHNKFKWSFTND